MNEQKNRFTWLCVTAVLLGCILSFVAAAAFGEECPPREPIEEILALTEVPEDVLKFIVDNGGIIYNEEDDITPVLHIDAVSERVMEYTVVDPEGKSVRVIGVFAKVFVGKSLDAMVFQGCQFIAKRKEGEPAQVLTGLS